MDGVREVLLVSEGIAVSDGVTVVVTLGDMLTDGVAVMEEPEDGVTEGVLETDDVSDSDDVLLSVVDTLRETERDSEIVGLTDGDSDEDKDTDGVAPTTAFDLRM